MVGLMDRRRFLHLLTLGGAAGLALDVDRLLWVPGARTFFDIQAPTTFTVLNSSGYPLLAGMLLELEREIFRVAGVAADGTVSIRRFSGLQALVRDTPPLQPGESKIARIVGLNRAGQFTTE
jgi:hypothetical protein